MKKQIDLYKFTSKDNIRPVMTGVYHDPEAQVAVASDLHILVAYAGAYDPDRAGQVVRKDGTVPVYDSSYKGKEEQPLPYPKWKQCIPAHNINTFPMDQLREAVRRADNFRSNLPKETKEGVRINRKHDKIILIVKAGGKTWAGDYCDDFRIGLDYKHAKMLCELPAEGAVVTFEDGRHTVLYKNEAEGITALFMPVYLGEKRLCTDEALHYGLYNDWEITRPEDTGSYIGMTFISALGDSEAARSMFCKKEREKATYVKCVEVTGKDEEGESVVGVRRRISVSLLHIPGTDTFYYVEDKRTGEYPVFKKDGGYFIRVHTHKADTAAGWSRITSQVQREGWDGMSYGDIAKSVGWTPENHKTVAAWGRINAIAS